MTRAPRRSPCSATAWAETLAAIHAAQEQSSIKAVINLAGPIDFSEGGVLREFVDPRWFDAAVISDAGNIAPHQMQSGFNMLRPTLQMSKWIGLMDRYHDEEARTFFMALEGWASDNTPFPAAAYETYIRELYQENRLFEGTHHARGRPVQLSAIECPVLTIVASKDTICPPKAATALNDAVSSRDTEVLSVPGGHVGAVVGRRAKEKLYPGMIEWCASRL